MQLCSTSLVKGGGRRSGLTPKTKPDFFVSDWVWPASQLPEEPMPTAVRCLMDPKLESHHREQTCFRSELKLQPQSHGAQDNPSVICTVEGSSVLRVGTEITFRIYG